MLWLTRMQETGFNQAHSISNHLIDNTLEQQQKVVSKNCSKNFVSWMESINFAVQIFKK